jgi:hypothetical protein
MRLTQGLSVRANDVGLIEGTDYTFDLATGAFTVSPRVFDAVGYTYLTVSYTLPLRRFYRKRRTRSMRGK